MNKRLSSFGLKHIFAVLLSFTFPKYSQAISLEEMRAEEAHIEMAHDEKMTVIDVDSCICAILTDLATNNETLPEIDSLLYKKFSSLELPDFSFRDFVDRIRKYGNFEPSILISTLIHLDSFVIKTGIQVKFNNVFRVFSAALLVTQKYLMDSPFNNKSMARLCGMELSELNELEADFLFAIKFNLLTDHNTYKKYAQKIKQKIVDDKKAAWKKNFKESLSQFSRRLPKKTKALEEPIFHLPDGLDASIE